MPVSMLGAMAATDCATKKPMMLDIDMVTRKNRKAELVSLKPTIKYMITLNNREFTIVIGI